MREQGETREVQPALKYRDGLRLCLISLEIQSTAASNGNAPSVDTVRRSRGDQKDRMVAVSCIAKNQTSETNPTGRRAEDLGG